MKKVALKVNSAMRILRTYGISGLIEHTLGLVISIYYRIEDAFRRKQKPSITGAALEAYLKDLGVAKGSTVLVHSSWDSIKGSDITPLGLLNSIKNLVGESGTIAMPAYSGQQLDEGVEFSVDTSASRAGWLTEVFRRMDGVIRSANVTHPVCAVGPRAGFLVDQHHLGRNPWDKYSPYFRIGSTLDSWIIGIGVGHRLKIATSLHCVEGLLSEHTFYKRLFSKEIRYKYVSQRHGTGSADVKIWSGVIFPSKIHKYFKGKLFERTISGVDVYAIRARDLIEIALQQGIKGETMVIWPVPWLWLFRSSRKESARLMLDNLYTSIESH